MPQPLLEVEHVGKRFPGVEALRDVSLSLYRGEVHALLGQNGAGKSTLVKCISGVYPPDSGRIVLEGQEIGAYSPKHAYDLGIAVVHQRPQLLPWLSVAENVLLGQMPARKGVLIDRREANELTRALLARLRLVIDPEAPVARLGPPERQQVAIAKKAADAVEAAVSDFPASPVNHHQADVVAAEAPHLGWAGGAQLRGQRRWSQVKHRPVTAA